jgi:hypothetical protein
MRHGFCGRSASKRVADPPEYVQDAPETGDSTRKALSRRKLGARAPVAQIFALTSRFHWRRRAGSFLAPSGTFANVDERKLPLLRCGGRAFVPGPSRHTCRDDSSSTTPTVPTGDARRGMYEGAPGHCATKYALPKPLLATHYKHVIRAQVANKVK